MNSTASSRPGLQKCHRLTPNQLLAQTLVTSGFLTSRLQSLEKQGFISRSFAEHDRRSVVVSCKQIIEQALVDHAATQQQLLSGLNPTEQQQLVQLLQTFLQASATPAHQGQNNDV